MHCKLKIVSIEKNIFSGLIEKMQISGSQGDLGIYPKHSPLLTSIKPGILYFICKSGSKELFYISGGILEVQPDIITVLADTVIHSIELRRTFVLEKQKKSIIKSFEYLAKLRVIEMMKLLK